MTWTSRTFALPLAISLLACTACKQQWSFAPPGYASLRPGKPTAGEKLPYGGSEAVKPDESASKVVAAAATVPAPPVEKPAPPAETRPENSTDPPAKQSPNVSQPSLAFLEPGRSDALEAPAIGPPMLVPLTDDEAGEAFEKSVRPRLGQRIGIALRNSWTDYGNFYSWRTFRDLSIALGGAAVLANTQMDQHFRNWYQQDVRSPDTDRAAATCKTFGNGGLVIPIFAGMAVAGRLLDDWPVTDMLGEYGGRVTRAYAVGAPPLLLMQSLLGAERPNDNPGHYSYWKPFHSSHGVSGHAFMGSVPFITAANMTDNWVLKGGLYFASTLTGWSRINDDKHYLSQVCLGWYLGYLAARAVNDTQIEDTRFTVLPMLDTDGVGVMFVHRH